jgi:ribosomal protein S27E
MKIYRFIGRRSAGFAFAGMLLCNLIVMLTDFGQNHFREFLLLTLIWFLLFFVIMLTFRCANCNNVIALNMMGKILDEGKLGFRSKHSFYNLTCPDCGGIKD